MRVKVIHLERDTERLSRLQRHYAKTGLDYELFPAVYDDDRRLGIAKTYRNLARTAVEEQWGLDSAACQDDIRWPRHIPEPTAPLTVYGTGRPDGHVCPRAFAATDAMWELLAEVWDGTAQVCQAWKFLVEEHGVILNIVFHPDVPRAQEPVRPLVSSAI